MFEIMKCFRPWVCPWQKKKKQRGGQQDGHRALRKVTATEHPPVDGHRALRKVTAIEHPPVDGHRALRKVRKHNQISVDMDPEVWKHLPDHEDILRLILSRVPWDTNIRLRSVSKAFYAILSEPALFTWASMLTGTSFYTDHSSLEWVDGGGPGPLEQNHAHAVCLFGTSHIATYAVVNFELQQWCKLPPLGDLPFGDSDDFTITEVAEGLLLLERKVFFKGILDDDHLVDTSKLDRFVFNPFTKGFIKLPVVPKVEGTFGVEWYSIRFRMIMAVENELVTVVALEFSAQFDSRPRVTRILIWRQGSEDWEPLRTYYPSPASASPVENVVVVGGEIFLHTLEDRHPFDRVFSCGSGAVSPMVIFTGHGDFAVYEFYILPVFHLFQHQGVLKRLELRFVTGITELECRIKLFTFDHLRGSWEEEEIEMPRHIQKSLCVPLADGGTRGGMRSGTFMDVLGDTLCIGNRYKPDVFLLYNLLNKHWCEFYAKQMVNHRIVGHRIFLWSPKR